MGSLGIDALVTLAAAGAIAIGEAWEAAAVTFLFSLGEVLEGASLARARRALEDLVSWMPETARVDRGGWVDVPVEEIRQGERLALRSGEKLPVDGEVVAGRATVDTSRVTGESMPELREPGDRVIAGSIVQAGYLEVVATRVGAESTFQKVVALVLEAQESKPRVQAFLERFGRLYTPMVLLLAAGSLVVTRDVRLALTLLVVACPGALVMAAPVSLMSGLAMAARHGVLVRRASVLEALARLDTVVFDKTGTLTQGAPAVVATHTFHGWSEKGVLGDAVALEARSEHPLAGAVLAAARELGVTSGERSSRPSVSGDRPAAAEDTPWPVDELEVLPGRGLVARVQRESTGGSALLPPRVIHVGSVRLVQEGEIRLPDEARPVLEAEEAAGRTVVLVAEDRRVVGLLALEDPPRPEAAGAIAWLRKLGIRSLVILSGDRPAPVTALGRALGVDEARGGLLPQEKHAEVARLARAGHRMGMVGDGINDGPALSRADVAFAMGLGGTDLARGLADVVVAWDHLTQVPLAIELARSVVRDVRQNVALGVLTAGLLLAAVLAGEAHLGAAMLVHQLSVLAVIGNGLRLFLYRPRHENLSLQRDRPVSGTFALPKLGRSHRTREGSSQVR
ncbi:heavy metal translocating P-type ATPase [Limnochorda pilosa]|nr:cation-translocating P-type ATPase [Limnochorda pilosa]